MEGDLPPEQGSGLEQQQPSLQQVATRMVEYQGALIAGREINPFNLFSDILLLGNFFENMAPNTREEVLRATASFGESPIIQKALKIRIGTHYQAGNREAILADIRLIELLGLSKKEEFGQVLKSLERDFLPSSKVVPPPAKEEPPSKPPPPEPEPQPSKTEAAAPPKEFPNLFGEESPFEEISRTDTFTETGIGAPAAREIILARYRTSDKLPKGLGRWGQFNLAVDRKLVQNPGEWVKAPRPGDLVAIKIGRKRDFQEEGLMSNERSIYFRLNDIFSETDTDRPVRLVGYGIDEDSKPYLILEGIPTGENEFKSLDQIKQEGRKLEQAEALLLTLKIGKVLSRIHEQGITWGDLNEGNIFWDSKQIRLVDVESGQAFPKGERGSFGSDRERLAGLLFELLTGGQKQLKQMDDLRKLRQPIPDSYWEGVSPAARKVIERACYLIEKFYNPFTAEGTQEMLRDLEEAYRSSLIDSL